MIISDNADHIQNLGSIFEEQNYITKVKQNSCSSPTSEMSLHLNDHLVILYHLDLSAVCNILLVFSQYTRYSTNDLGTDSCIEDVESRRDETVTEKTQRVTRINATQKKKLAIS